MGQPERGSADKSAQRKPKRNLASIRRGDIGFILSFMEMLGYS
jgi:hypothetical protein